MSIFYGQYRSEPLESKGPPIGFERDDGEADDNGLKMRQLMVEENLSRENTKISRLVFLAIVLHFVGDVLVLNSSIPE